MCDMEMWKCDILLCILDTVVLYSSYRLVPHIEHCAHQQGCLPLQCGDVGGGERVVDPGGGGRPQQGHLPGQVETSGMSLGSFTLLWIN